MSRDIQPGLLGIQAQVGSKRSRPEAYSQVSRPYAKQTRLYPFSMCVRPLSCSFGTVRAENLCLRPVLTNHVPVLARLGKYALETWLYAPGRVCMFLFEPIWACMQSKSVCMPLSMCLRPLSCPFGTVRPKNLG